MTEQRTPPTETPLESWKAIATHLNRDVRTVIRWEQSERLPVHRHKHLARSSVYAFPSELDTWRANRKPEPRAVETRSTSAGSRLAAVAAVLLTLVSAGGGRFVGPISASQTAGQSGRQVWFGPTVDSTGGISRDGRWLSYSDGGTGEVIVRDLQSGQERRYSPKSSASEANGQAYRSLLSADGSRLLVLWQTPAIAPGASVRLIDLKASGAVKVVYEKHEWIALSAWSPDGRVVAIQLHRDNAWQIGLMSIPDGTLTILKTIGWRPSSALFFSSDGRRLAYDAAVAQGSTDHDIHILDVDGSREVGAVVHPSNDAVIGWAEDGTSLVFASNRSGRSALYAVPLDNGRPSWSVVLIKPDLGRLRVSYGVTRAGSLLYAIQTAATTIRTAEIDFETGKLLTPVIEPVETYQWQHDAPTWSPDGKSLAFLKEKPESRQVLAIRDMSSGAVRELPVQLDRFNRIAWPTNDAIILSGVDPKGRNGLFRADVKSGMLELMSGGPVAGRFAISRDGMTVYYRRAQNGRGSVFARNLRTDEEHQLAVAPTFTLSPDEGSFAFVEVTPAAGTAALKVVPVAGGEARIVRSFERGHGLLAMVRWTPDGKHLIYGRWIGSRETPTAFSVRTTGSPPVELDAAIPGHPSLAVHPDGRRVAFEHGGTELEVWALDNFLSAVRR